MEIKHELEQKIQTLSPFKDLAKGDLIKLAKTGSLLKKVLGDTIYAADANAKMLYLLKGKLDICYPYTKPELVHAESVEALKPIFSDKEQQGTYLYVQSNCEIWQFDKELFNRLIEKEVIIDEHILSQQISHVESNIYNEILLAVESGQLQLPSLPEIALRIKKAVEQSDAGIEQISKIVELDPALSTRLIQVANSPLTRGAEPIHNMRDVIVRLGLKVTRNMVLSFSVAQLFSSKHTILKKQMKVFYAHSIEIASICYALGSQIKTLDADELLLAGLIHDIGVIPIISYIEKTGLEFSSEQEVLHLIKSLRVATGVLVVKAWDLPTEMLNVVNHAEHWQHNSGEGLNLEDIVIIAQIYDLLRRKQASKLPDINNIPVFNKLFPDKQHDPAFAIQVLDQARQEVDAMKVLLGI